MIRSPLFPPPSSTPGTHVPPGVMLIYSPYVLGRNPEVWTKYPTDEFRPERWVERTTLPNDYAYPHFNAGKRGKLGCVVV